MRKDAYLVRFDLAEDIIFLHLIADLFLPPHVAFADAFGKRRDYNFPYLPCLDNTNYTQE